MHRRLGTWSIGLLAASLGLAGFVGGVAQADPGYAVTPVVIGLSNPRGVAVDEAGNLFVAQAGAYQGEPQATPPILAGDTMTGSVSKFNSAGNPIWTRAFQSMFDTEHGPEVLGPGGVSLAGNNVLMIMNESQAATGLDQMGNLYKLDGDTGTPTAVSDVGNQMYGWTGANATQPWAPTYGSNVPQFPDSNPYAVLVARVPSRSAGHDDHGRGGSWRTFVADAGANTVSEIMPDGTARIIAYLPNTPVSDAIPTCIAQGPDGNLYVGTLHLADNMIASGSSVVYRINPNRHGNPIAAGSSSVWATGLTTVTACTFDSRGNFWATEMFYQGGTPVQLGPGMPASGDIAKISFRDPTSVTHYGWHTESSTDFPVPGGIAAADGSLYVSVGSDLPFPGGKVVKVTFGS